MIFYCMSYVLWLIDLLCCSVITCFGFELKDSKKNVWKCMLGLFFVQLPFTTLKFFFNYQPLLRSAGMIGTVVAATIFTIYFFKGYKWQHILFVIFRIICCCMAELLSQYIFDDLMRETGKLTFDKPVVVGYIAMTEMVFIVLFLLFTILWKRFILKIGSDLKIFFIFIIFPISQIIMISNFNIRIFTQVTPTSIAAVISMLLGIFADVLLMILLLRQQSMHEMEIQLKEVEKAWEVEQNHYRDIEARREELAKIRHDISEQFIVMQELLHMKNYDKIEEMLNTLREYVSSTKEDVYCGDSVINAIMAENEKECMKNNVKLNYHFEIMQPLKINPVVICSIFSNLMRNALTATKEIADSDKAIIDIRAAVKGDYLIVKMENAFISEKKKKNRKGYGLEILRTLAEQYNGQMDTIIQDGKYYTTISVENI